MPAARVTDDHLVVPASVLEPVVVSFDGQYVWSFSPQRDGARGRGGWHVPWPTVLQTHLDGTARVLLTTSGDAVLHDDTVAFRDNRTALTLQDHNGHPLAVDRAGHLTRVFAETGDDVRRQVAEGTARAITDLREQVGVEAHLSYGGLLGAVRDGRMIGHDTDTDLAYLSRFTHPADIVLESYRIEREMRRLGWKVVRMSSADLKLFLPLPDGSTVQIDVFGAFHVGGVFYQMGARSGSLPREALLPLSTVTLEGVDLAAPADPEAVLAFLYGPGWRVPDPSFQNVDPGTGVRRIEGWMRGVRTDLAEWNEIFRTRRSEVPKRGSPFAVWVRRRIPADALVVDLGSGTGRDSGWFAGKHHRVIAFDYAGAALRFTRGRLGRAGVETPDVRVLPFNDLRGALLAGAEMARLPEPPFLYGRQLVGCLDADARANLWLLCSMALRRGGSLHLEYAATRRGLRRRTTDGLVRRADTEALAREIAAAGGRVVHQEHGEGKDFFGEPDPHVARLEVVWTPDPTARCHSPDHPDVHPARRHHVRRLGQRGPDHPPQGPGPQGPQRPRAAEGPRGLRAGEPSPQPPDRRAHRRGGRAAGADRGPRRGEGARAARRLPVHHVRPVGTPGQPAPVSPGAPRRRRRARRSGPGTRAAPPGAARATAAPPRRPPARARRRWPCRRGRPARPR